MTRTCASLWTSRVFSSGAVRFAFLLLSFVWASLSAQEKNSTVPHAGGYRIAGTVLNTATGDPVQRAVVSALAVDDNHSIASVVSDAEGHFAFEGLAAAKYPLTASKRGYRTASYDDHDGYNTAIVTGPDQDTAHLIYFLVPGAVLHGVVSGDGGDPVEGARVMLFEKPRHHAPDARIVQSDSAVTDDTGAYEFGNLADGDYLVAVSAQPWYAMRRANEDSGKGGSGTNAQLDVAYPITYFDSTTDEASATPISLAKGSRVEADITLHAVPALGIVVDMTRRPDGRLARPELQQLVFGTQIAAESVGFVGALKRGSAEFNGLAPGHYELTAGDPPHVMELDATQSGHVDPDSGSATTALTGVLRMPRGGLPPDEAHLFLQPQEGAQSHASLATSARNGRFHFDSVASGTWTVGVEGEGKMMPVLAVETGSAAHAGNVLTVRDRPMNVVVTLGEGIARIDGITQKDGKGFGGAMIVLVPKQTGNLETLARRDQSDSDGSFSLRDVVPGQYTVVAIEDGWELDWTQPEVLARYLPSGTAVTVNDSSGDVLHLSGPVVVQPR
jgi:carboxypeptidase family protein